MSIGILANDQLIDYENVFRLVQIDLKLKEIKDCDKTKSPFRLTRLVKANDVIIFSLSDSTYRVLISAGKSSYDRFDLPLRTGDQVDHIFLDHTGYHCIISLLKGAP